ncbi:MAG: hypothetical protein WCE81_07500 [Halobacteriota archaeon]
MPYKDKETQREYNREYQRQRRAGVNGKGPASKSGSHSSQPSPLFETPYRIEKAKDLLKILEDVINSVREDDMITSLQRARTLGYLISIGIRIIETSNMEGRIEALEQVLKNRSENMNKHANTTQMRSFELK